jgi:hypothetical protein
MYIINTCGGLIVGMMIGLAIGFRLGAWAVATGFLEGRWTRGEMERLLHKWRGPSGERW